MWWVMKLAQVAAHGAAHRQQLREDARVDLEKVLSLEPNNKDAQRMMYHDAGRS